MRKGHGFLTGSQTARLPGAAAHLAQRQRQQRNGRLGSIDEIFYMPDEGNRVWNREHTLNSVSVPRRETIAIDRIVPLDEFDQELAAAQLRAHLCLPGT